MESKVQVKTVANYGGHAIKPNGNVDLKLKCEYSELTGSVQMLQMLNNDITVLCKLPSSKPLKIGVFRLKNMNIDHDGQSVVTLNSQVDFVEVDNITQLITDEKFQLRMEAEIENEESGE